MEKVTDALNSCKGVKAFNFNSSLFKLIDGLSDSPDKKWELLCFAYEFIVNGKLIDISKDNDKAIDKLYPICRSLRLAG